MDITSSPLIQAFTTHPSGLCGHFEPAHCMIDVEDVDKRLGILAFGTLADSNPIPKEQWEELVQIQDHWIFDVSQTSYMSSQQVLTAMKQARIRVPNHIARVWWQVSRGVQGRVQGSWRELLQVNDDDSQTIQLYLDNSSTTFPVLSGPVISARWLDLIHRVGGVALQGWESLHVPLTKDLEEPAQRFGVKTSKVHPVLSSALRIWKDGCKNLSGKQCGLKTCPHP